MDPTPIQGFKTIIAAVVGGSISPWLANHIGLTLDPSQQAAVVAGIMGGIMIVMRFFTKTSIFKKTSTAPMPAGTPPSVAAANVAKVVTFALMLGALLSAGSQLTGCATMQKIDTAITSPAAQPFISAAIDVAVATAEAKGVSATQINSIAKAALAADSGVSASLSVVSAVVNAKIAALKLPVGDEAAAQILEDALEVAIQAQIAKSTTSTTAVANTQAAIADVLNALIASTGG